MAIQTYGAGLSGTFFAQLGLVSYFSSFQPLTTRARYCWRNPKPFQYCRGHFIYQSLGRFPGSSRNHPSASRQQGKASTSSGHVRSEGTTDAGQAPPASPPAPAPSRAATGLASGARGGARGRRRGARRQPPRQAGRREGAERL